MKINGLVIDTDKLGAGLYGIICEMNEEHIVAHGMIPNAIIQMAERLLREKVLALSLAQLECSEAEALSCLKVDEDKMNATIAPIMREVSVAIFRTAKAADKMLV